MSNAVVTNRVLHIVPSVANEASGPSYSVVRLCESLQEYGQNVTLATLDWAPISSRSKVLRSFSSGVGPRRLGRSPSLNKWLLETAEAGVIDIIHNHSLWMMPNVYAGRVARRYRVPLVVSPRGTLSEIAMQSGTILKRVFWPLVQRPALAATTCFHATAESEYEDIRRMGFHQPVAVIPNGVDISDLAPKKKGGPRILLFLGRIHPIKGLDILLPAWKAVQSRFPDWHLHIVGPSDGDYLDQMRLLATKLSLERVEFCGPIFGKRKKNIYQHADLFVLPTYSENFGVSVAEALAAGTPAIVSKGAPWEGVQTNEVGWWIDIGLAPLVACLEEALGRSPEVLAEMGERGRTWMATEYSWKRVGQQMVDTYHWILRSGNRPDWVRED